MVSLHNAVLLVSLTFCFLPLFKGSLVTVVSVAFNKNSGCLDCPKGGGGPNINSFS